MRYLAIDYGGKRTGLAVCDASEIICSPLDVLATNSELVERIAGVICDQQAEGVVIGLPLNMDGSEGDAVKTVRKFGDQLEKKIEVAIYYHDERQSSQAAERKFAGMLTRKKKKQRLDAVAAAGILESFLESKGSV